MKVVVLGAGVVGVTTAYYLSQQGVEVTVVDRRADVAQETSAVNAGLIAPGHAFTWASPRAMRTLARSLAGRDTALRMHWRIDPELWRWGIKFLKNCSVERSTVNTLRRLSLSQYSKSVMDELVASTDLDFHRNTNGALFLFRNPATMEAGIERLRLLKEHGEEQRYLDAEDCAAIEPALEPVKKTIAGAVYSPTALSGDSALFTRQLADAARRAGARFLLNTSVTGFVGDRSRINAVQTSGGTIEADRYVLALGTGSRRIAKSVGLDLPIYPVKGYTMTAPVVPGALAPRTSGIDEDMLVAWSRFGETVRMTGTADFAGHDLTMVDQDARSIFRSGGELFPDCISWEEREMRVGLRPVTPHELPYLGATRIPQLFLNTGHGNLGWTMAAGSARIVTDLLLGEAPEMHPTEFGVPTAS